MDSAQANSDQCCPSGTQNSSGSGFRIASLFSAVTAVGLAGVGCLGCIPFIGAVIASSSLATALDEHLKALQILLIGVSALFSALQFQKRHWPSLLVSIAGLAYLALIFNALNIQSRFLGISSIIVLVFAHVARARPTAEKHLGLSLLYFKDCPNVPILKALMKEENISSYIEIDLEQLSQNDPLRSYSSPSLLQNGELIIGSRTSNSTLSCSFYSKEEMRKALRLRTENLKT